MIDDKETNYVPDAKMHLYVSIAKSILRLGAAVTLMSEMFIVAGVLFLLAEILGIVEEVV